MLKELIINNFAIISELKINFDTGMTSLTGETGAGKSIIIDALGLIVGNRSSTDFIRTGEESLKVQGLFDISKNNPSLSILDEMGIEHDDNSIIIDREINHKGRNVCHINGVLVNTNSLRNIGKFLVEIHGQNQQQELLTEDNHITILDRYNDDDLVKQLEDYQANYSEYNKQKAKLDLLQKNAQSVAQRIDMLKFQIEEIDGANLKENEDVTLDEEKNRLANFEKISNALNESYQLLSENNVGTVDTLGTVRSNVESISELDREYSSLFQSLDGAYYQLQDDLTTISNLIDSLDFDESRLEEIQKRLLAIDELKKKYGPTLDEIIQYGQSAHEELSQLDLGDRNLDELKEDLSKKERKLISDAERISELRKQTAKKIEKSINSQFVELQMKNARFKVKFERLKDSQINNNGLDLVSFELKTNVGEDFKPLVKVASGGELSRVILAFETILATKMNVETIIFDEIDTGVSGKVAQSIGDKIYTVSQSVQVLCITHLPQVAAMSDKQFLIKKETVSNKTQTRVSLLDDPERIDAISLMLAGTKITDVTKEHAEELLNLAKDERKKLD
ncbi:DNA repair protein RecN [Companilactobacillus metriopterae]|uniref:DNA repair protein RecN n=1 Tax=Companilactobacillus metriopterae TaxID=1909267 RepID=UPI00100BD290|nr:DNA repair protein RecN [Companilactobacillus metriopterae]